MRRIIGRQPPIAHGIGRLAAAAALVIAIAGFCARALACDLCAIYTSIEQRESRTGFFAALSEQFSDYETEQQGGEKVPNPAGERLHSFNTQVIGGYNFTPRIAVQINVPVVVRDFRRLEAHGIVNGDESGIGDLAVVGSWAAYTGVTESTVTRFTLLGGLKLPSGNSRRLQEELRETEDVHSGIHGHDLALGSGSVDGIIGAQLFSSWRRAFVTGSIQYALRTEGSFRYRYANDLIWAGGPGEYVLLTHQYTIGVQAEFGGESKGNDTLSALKGNDTAITALYLGPDVRFTWGMSLAANIAVDLPIIQNNSAFQIVPNYRLRGGVTWKF